MRWETMLECVIQDTESLDCPMGVIHKFITVWIKIKSLFVLVDQVGSPS